MDIHEEHVAPRLSGEGAELLAKVLAKRAERHDTPVAERHSRRRESDPLRQDVVDQSERLTARPVAKATSAKATSNPTPSASPVPERKSAVGSDDGRARWLPATAVAACIAVGFFLAIFFGTRYVNADDEARPNTAETAQSDDSIGTEVLSAGLDETNTESTSDEQTSGEALAIDPATEVEPTATSRTSAIPATPEAGDIEVLIYDNEPSTGEEYSFALRIKSVSATEELITDVFDVRVEDEFGEEATTSSRFVHDTLPVGSSALATVRAVGATPGQQFLVLTYNNVELVRVPIEAVAP